MITNSKSSAVVEPLLAEGGEGGPSINQSELSRQSTDTEVRTSTVADSLDQVAIVSTFREVQVQAPKPFYRYPNDKDKDEGTAPDGAADDQA